MKKTQEKDVQTNPIDLNLFNIPPPVSNIPLINSSLINSEKPNEDAIVPPAPVPLVTGIPPPPPPLFPTMSGGPPPPPPFPMGAGPPPPPPFPTMSGGPPPPPPPPFQTAPGGPPPPPSAPGFAMGPPKTTIVGLSALVDSIPKPKNKLRRLQWKKLPQTILSKTLTLKSSVPSLKFRYESILVRSEQNS